uniref:Uncharacterized protein n=1 Tax=Glossina palpalis gambiensis TaxID=67801 RepID=A0A1B0B0A7_9MUSC
MYLSIVTNDQLRRQRYVIERDFESRSKWRRTHSWYPTARERASSELFRAYKEVQQKYGEALFKEYVKERHLNENVYRDIKAENLDYERFGKFAAMKRHMDHKNHIIFFHYDDRIFKHIIHMEIVFTDQLRTVRKFNTNICVHRRLWKRLYSWYPVEQNRLYSEMERVYKEVREKHGKILFKQYVKQRRLNERIYRDIKAENLDYVMYGKYEKIKRHMDKNNQLSFFYCDDSSNCLHHRHKKRHRHKKPKILVQDLETQVVKVIDPDDLPQRARWTIIATACLLLLMCLMLVGITLRMAPIIDEMDIVMYVDKGRESSSNGRKCRDAKCFLMPPSKCRLDFHIF